MNQALAQRAPLLCSFSFHPSRAEQGCVVHQGALWEDPTQLHWHWAVPHPGKGCSGSGASLPCPTTTPTHHPESHPPIPVWGETDKEPPPVHNLSSAPFPWGMLLKGIILCARTFGSLQGQLSAHLLKTMGAGFCVLQCCGPLLGLILCIAPICFSLNWLWLIKDVTVFHTILNLLNLGTKKCTETLRERAKSLTAYASIIRPDRSQLLLFYC